MAQFNVKIKTSDDQNLEFDLENADQTLASVLVDKLREDPHVTFAAYRVAHPLIGIPTVRVSTDGEETPLQAIGKAVNALSDILSKLMEDAEKLE